MILILFYIFCFLFVYSQSKGFGDAKRMQYQTWLCFLLLFVFFCFRGLPVLNDTHHYYNGQLAEIKSGCMDRPFYNYNPASRYGAGYQIFQHVVANVSDDPYALIFFSALIFTIASIWFLRKFSDDIALPIFLMLGLSLLFGEYAALRQCLAIVLFYISCWCNINQKHILGLLLIFLAMQFHSSAYVLFLFYAVSQFNVTRRRVAIALILCIVVCFALLPILTAFDYGDNHYVTDMQDRTSVPISALLTTILFGISMWYSSRLGRMYDIEEPDRMIVWGAILGLFFNAASVIVIAFDRLALYTSIFNVLFFTHYFLRAPKYERSIIMYFIVIVVACRMSLEMGVKNEWKHLVPYSFYDFSLPGYQDFGY